MKAPVPCLFCGLAIFGDIENEAVHPCCAAVRAEGRGLCVTCLSTEEVRATRRADASPGEPVPPEVWDWRAIWTAEATARARIDAKPACTICGRPMVCGQRRAHVVCINESDANIGTPADRHGAEAEG